VAAPSTIADRKTPDPAGAGGLHLVVMGADEFRTLPLPPSGEVVIGRGEGVDVALGDPLASRRHARLYVGPPLTVEDLGSANGTRLRETPLPAGQAVRLLPGEAIAIGSTILMVQQNRPRPPPRAVLAHTEFEGRIDWECARAEATAAPFSLVRLQLGGRADAAALLAAAAPLLRPVDLLGAYGPGEYEVLLPGLGPEAARGVTRALAAALGARTRTAVVSYPADGRHASALLARAGAGLRREAEKVTDAEEIADAEAGPLDEEMRRVQALAARAAAGTINLLVLGETGAGKEVLARRIHRMSPRAGRPFVCINCAALSESLLESELFGHERGAFTGAGAAKPGLLETAPGGTVFLDEVGELPLPLQAKLLRVIESREILRVGSVRPRPIDVRFIAATNRDLEAEVAAGAFRRDLYFRLNGMTLVVPPLRERPREITALARQFLAELAPATGRRTVPRLATAARAALLAHPWPGNVRELRNVIERALLVNPGDELTELHLPKPAPELVGGPAPAGDERARILAALTACGGNQSRAARQLGISRKVLLARLDAYGVRRPRKGQGS
jgi:DNA-binding NtrC family response regulator